MSEHLSGAEAGRKIDQSSESSKAATLVMQLSLSRAAELARAGHYAEAENLLRMMEPAQLPIAGLDLLARICAQQGRLQEARQWWQEVLKRDPTNRPAQSGLESLAQIPTAQPDGQSSVRRWWLAIRSRLFPKKALPPSVDLNLQIPGLLLRAEGNTKVIYFQFHPFGDHGAVLTDQGKKTLCLLGWQLEPWVGKIAIEIVGQPDCLPETQEALPEDVAALGMTRAYAVFTHLVQTTKLQARMFSLRTGDEFLHVPAEALSQGSLLECPPVCLRISFL